MRPSLHHLLSDNQNARLDNTQNELHRLYLLDDIRLGYALLSLARAARADYPKILGRDQACYDTALVWDLVPEIAARLGVDDPVPGERQAEDISALSDRTLRLRVGYCLKNCNSMRSYDSERRIPTPWELLTHEVANGNPVAFALDRLSPFRPGEKEEKDEIIKTCLRVNSLRGYFDRPSWIPDWDRDPEEMGRPRCEIAQRKLLEDAAQPGLDAEEESTVLSI